MGDILLPLIRFDRPEFQAVLDQFRASTIDPENTKGSGSFSAEVDGFRFDYGLGGIHGSIESAAVRSSDTDLIIDLDVTSYYPSIPIAHRFYPQHLGEGYCEVYESMLTERLKHARGTIENAGLKIALNSVYGLSNSKFSPFYDPQYTMATTINGQLMLTMLSEWLMRIPGLKMIQANTDGVTVLCPREHEPRLTSVAAAWERLTGLDLGRADYSRMWIRDVNNYAAEYEGSGKVKRKGAYRLISEMQEDGDWHKDMSKAVVQIAASEYLLNGTPVDQTIRKHTDVYDFCIKSKCRRVDRQEWGDQATQRITRYYVTTEGHGAPLRIVRPRLAGESEVAECRAAQIEADKLNKQAETTRRHIAANARKGSPLYPQLAELRARRNAALKEARKLQSKANRLAERPVSVCAGHVVQVCNRIDHATAPINYDYYIDEARKLVAPFGG